MSHNSSFPPGLPADPLICRGPQRIRDVRQQITGCWALWAWHRDRGRRGLLGHTGACLPGASTASRPNELTWTWCMFLQLCWVFCSQRSTSFSCSSTCLWRCVMNECQSIRSPPVSDLIKSKLKKVQNIRGRLRITSGKQLFGTTILAYTSPTASILDLPEQSVPLGLTCSQYIAKIPSLGQ